MFTNSEESSKHSIENLSASNALKNTDSNMEQGGLFSDIFTSEYNRKPNKSAFSGLFNSKNAATEFVTIETYFEQASNTVAGLIPPGQVTDENLDEAVKKIDELIDFYISIEKGAATERALAAVMIAALQKYLYLKGFYAKILQIKEENLKEIIEYKKQKSSKELYISIEEKKLTNMKNRRDINSIALQSPIITQLGKLKEELEAIKRKIIHPEKKSNLLEKYIEFLKKADYTGFPPTACQDPLWCTEIILSYLIHNGFKYIDKEKCLKAVIVKNIAEIFELVYLTNKLFGGEIPNFFVIGNIGIRMKPFTLDELDSNIAKLNNVKQNKKMNEKQKEVLDEILKDLIFFKEELTQPLLSSVPSLVEETKVEMEVVSTSSAPPLAEETKIEAEDSDDEFCDANLLDEKVAENIKYGAALVAEWKQRNSAITNLITDSWPQMRPGT